MILKVVSKELPVNSKKITGAVLAQPFLFSKIPSLHVEKCNIIIVIAVLICTKMFNDYQVDNSRKQNYFVEYQDYRITKYGRNTNELTKN